MYVIIIIYHTQLAKQERDTCKVFATDAILATLMTCTRSRYSWDIVVNVSHHNPTCTCTVWSTKVV